MEENDLKQLIAKVSEIRNPEERVALETLKGYINFFRQEGRLKEGILNLEGLDESERAEFLKLAQRFDKELYDALKESC